MADTTNPNRFCTDTQVLSEGNSTSPGLGPCTAFCQLLRDTPGTTSSCDNLIFDICQMPANWNNPVCGCAKPTTGPNAPPNSGYQVLNIISGATGTANVIPSIPIGCLRDCSDNIASKAIVPRGITPCSANYQLCLNTIDINNEGKIQGGFNNNVKVTTNCSQNGFTPSGGPNPNPSFFDRYKWFIIGGIAILIILIILIIVVVAIAVR